MTQKGSREVTVTKVFPARLANKVRQHFKPILILGVAICSSLVGHARACSVSDGQTGVASWYGPGLQGNRTASGGTFDMWAMTAAHPCLPMGTKLLVTVLGTGRSLVVTVNDRLPSRRRVLDLSAGAARVLGISGQGLAVVELSSASPRLITAW
ncbi:MAG TPA: septal ring lytic transglycosylase RlpA family protein [Acetobacteraceae bacterium]|nr:septal ring lytic transglycosylase RlpA family protein [Acetobacteraceae bacterium]